MDVPRVVGREMPFARRTVDADGVRLSVVDDGPTDRPPLVFLHGNPTWSFLWRRLLGPARAAGHRVVAPDLAGFGMSEKPAAPTYHSVDRHVRNLEIVADELGLRDATVVVHDWGGPFGLGLAVRRPDVVRRIVVTNTVAFAPRRKRALSAWHRAFATRIGHRLGVHLDLVRRTAMAFGVRRRLPREVRAAYAWPMRDVAARRAAAALVRMVPDGPEHPTAEALRRIEIGFPALAAKPMLVLWADRDPVMPPRLAEKWAKAFPHADVRHVSQGGHFWQEDDPEAFLGPILEFAKE